MIGSRPYYKVAVVTVLLLMVGCGPAHRLSEAPPPVVVEVDADAPLSSSSVSAPSQNSDAEVSQKEGLSEQLPSEQLSLLSAVRFALANNHSLRIARQQYDISKGSHMQAGGQFDWSMTNNFKVARVLEPLTKAEQESYRYYYSIYGWDEEFSKYDQSSYSLALSRKTRTGVEFSQNVNVSHIDDTTFYADAENEAEVMFTVDVPLLRGRGDSASANERSAAVLAEASGLDVVHQSSSTVQDVANLYWDYRAADQYRAIAEASEQRARTMLDETRLLVDAGQQPRASLMQLVANLEDKKATRLARTLAVVNARNALGLALGLSVDQFSKLAPPVDEFPRLSSRDIGRLSELSDGLSVSALQRRQDFRAQCKRVGSANILLKAARQNMLPLLNVSAGAGYRGFYEGGNRDDLFQSLDGDASDVEWNAALSLVVPIGNHALKGAYQQRLGQYEQALTKQNQLASNILSGVISAIATIQSTSAELSASINAFNSYKQALEDEQEKYRLGLATSLDVINTEDRLSQANQRVISARSQLAQAVVNLRFATGRLVEASGESFRVRDDSLESLAFADLGPVEPNDCMRPESGAGE